MTTSNSYNYNVTANDIITEALGLIGVYSPGESIDSSESADALRSLNMMIKAWQMKYGLWLNRELSLFMQDDTISYLLGPTGTHCAEDAVKTEVATAAASGASSVVVDATTGMNDTFDRNGICAAQTPTGAGSFTLNGALVSSGTATLSSNRKICFYSDADDSGDTYSITGKDTTGKAVTETISGPNTTTVYSTNEYRTITSITTTGAGTGNIEIGQVGDHVGIELDDSSVQWTNIGAALSTTLTLITTLTDTVAVNNHVYSYKIKTERPTEIMEARRVHSDATETPLIIGGRHDYTMLSNKTTEAIPTQVYYDKQLTNGVFKVWPEPSEVKTYIKMTARIPIADIDSLTNDFEFAQEWYEAIAWNLAVRLSPKYNKPIEPTLGMMALKMLDDAMISDSENAPVSIQIRTQ